MFRSQSHQAVRIDSTASGKNGPRYWGAASTRKSHRFLLSPFANATAVARTGNSSILNTHRNEVGALVQNDFSSKLHWINRDSGRCRCMFVSGTWRENRLTLRTRLEHRCALLNRFLLTDRCILGAAKRHLSSSTLQTLQ